ncbi:hypothetical protein SS50377_24034 [Spironucleus salmonicida]|uniref:Uncharacterized protein n=1 Tax=Spironucleus salmonicida TaxID=348837 RepID=V6LR38_9EUKA|nr:hypothetical protein SS50377_24034 [Spironucleus salmonicida]|eukprot:EST47065.1 Hypothetical protein SS50377_12873 [Spironucleus salmonicida]
MNYQLPKYAIPTSQQGNQAAQKIQTQYNSASFVPAQQSSYIPNQQSLISDASNYQVLNQPQQDTPSYIPLSYINQLQEQTHRSNLNQAEPILPVLPVQEIKIEISGAYEDIEPLQVPEINTVI